MAGKLAEIWVDERGFVRADGLCIARRVVRNQRVRLEIKDAAPRRAQQRGSDYIEVDLEDLLRALGIDS